MFKKERGAMLVLLPIVLVLIGLSISIIVSNHDVLTKASDASNYSSESINRNAD